MKESNALAHEVEASRLLVGEFSARTPKSKRLRRIDLCLIAIVALLGLVGQAPLYHPDYLTAFVGNVFETKGNPLFFHYGCLVIYVMCIVYGIAYLLLRIFGLVASIAEFQTLLDSEYLITRPVALNAYFPGQLFVVACSFVALISVFWIAHYATGRRLNAYFAVILMGSSYQWVIDSHFLTVDVPMAAMVIASVALALFWYEKVIDGQGVGLSIGRYAIYLGLCTGLIAGAKYPGGLIGLPFLMVATSRTSRYEEKLKLVTIFCLCAAAVFLLTNPFIVLDFPRFWSDFKFEAIHARTGHPGFTSNSFWFHSLVSLPDALGLLGLLLSVVGLFVLLLRRKFPIYAKVLLLLYPALHFLVISNSALSFQRYVVPLLPFLAIYFAVSLLGIDTMLSQYLNAFVRRGVVSCLALLSIVPNFAVTSEALSLLDGRDSREELKSIVGNEALGSIYVSSYLRYFFRNHPRSIAQGQGPEALFLDSFTYDRDLYEKCRVEVGLLPLFSSFDRVMIVSPYSQVKEQVPFSPQSLFAPARPDLPFRKIAGPYIEVYYSHASSLAKKLESSNSAYASFLPSSQGYYAKKLVQGCKDEAPELMGIEKEGYRPRSSGLM